MIIVKKEKNKILSIPTSEVNINSIRTVGSELAVKILKAIYEKPDYPLGIARRLGVNEQKVYYHIKHLERAGIIEVADRVEKSGSTAKIYRLKSKSFFFKLGEFEEANKIIQVRNESSFLKEFIHEGELNAKIIVGSPDPHGPERARSRDGYYGIDLALFLGTFLNYVPDLSVKLDTEVRESDLNNNLILIGGPVINKVSEKVNNYLPIFFKKDSGWNLFSKLSNKTYSDEETGAIVKIDNPFFKGKKVLLIAGKRYSGTRAAITAMLKHFDEVKKGNSKDPNVKARVVLGLDLNSDGIVDDVEFLE